MLPGHTCCQYNIVHFFPKIIEINFDEWQDENYALGVDVVDTLVRFIKEDVTTVGVVNAVRDAATDDNSYVERR